MKKIAITLSITAMAACAFAQGTVNFNNVPSQLINTNGLANGGTRGATAAGAAGTFYYGLFIAPVGQTIGGVADLFSGPWTFTGTYGTNTAAAGRLSGGPGTGVPVTGWAGGTSADYVLAGWSANLGHDWAQVMPLVQGGPGSYSPSQFFGASLIGEGISGGGPLGQPVLALFGAAAPNIQGFDLMAGVPEPTTFVLGGLGVASLLIFRRRRA